MPWGALTPTGVGFLTSPAEGRLAGLDGVEQARQLDGVLDVHIARRSGDPVRPPTDAYDRIGHVIASAGTVPRLDRLLDTALDRITVRVAKD